MKSKANPSHSSLQTLDFLPFSPLFFLKNEICSPMSPKTTCLVFIKTLKCKALFSLHTFYHFSSFFYLFGLKSFILFKPCLAQNPLFHLGLLFFHFGHSFIIISPRHLFFITIDP